MARRNLRTMTAQALQSPRMALGSDGAAPRAASEIGQGTDGPGPPSGQAPEELVEIQLRAILEATQTSAGAVCLFDQHQELLRLAVEIGLSDEGCRRLRSVRRGAATTWDMPLHSLLNRRVYLIESAAKNRYVPPLVDDIAMVRAVACVPLYDASTPVGSLILIAMAPRTFGERQIRLLEQPVRELVGHIVSMRKRVSLAAPPRTGRPSLSATATAQPAAAMVAGPTVPGIKVAPGGAPVSSSIQAAVDRARAELERLRSRLTEADEATATERRRADALDQQREALRAEHDALGETLATRTSEIASLMERVTALEATLEETRRGEAALRAELEQARGTVASEGAKAVETTSARVVELEATNEALRRRVAELETAEAGARAEAEERLTRLAAEAETRLATTADVQTRAATLAAECDELRARLAAAEAAHDQARTDAAASHAAALADVVAQHATALADAEARTVAAAATALDWQHRYEATDAELAVTRTMAGSHGEQVDALAQQRAEREAELVATREREAELARRVAELEAALERTRGELDRTRDEDLQLRDGFAHLESLIQTGVESSAPLAAATGPALADGAGTFEVVELDDASPPLDDAGGTSLDAEGLVIEEVESTPPVEVPAPVVAMPATPPAGLLVVDTDACWTAAARGAPVTVLAPDGTPAPDMRPERLLVNLAAPNALAGLSTLRQGGVTAPAFGCIVIPGQARGLLIGRLDLAARPIDPDALLAGLQGTFARGTRVVTAGADVDGLISLRQALARLGVSVSMAWDAKQAGDLLAMVHPEVAIIDLELPPKDGCALVARMGLVQPAPLTVVIPKAMDTATAFAATLAHPELARMMVPAQELLARVLAYPLKTASIQRR